MESKDCLLVILAGGLGTRLKPLTDKVPKSMLEVEGKPFLEHQIELVKKHGLQNILLLTGHQGETIEKHFQDGSRFGVSIKYSRESSPAGTAGALKLAEPLLPAGFLLMYGDAYLDFQYGRLWERFRHCARKAVMAIFRNDNRWGRSNVAYDLPLVVRYCPASEADENRGGQNPLVYIDYGVSAISKDVLSAIPEGKPWSMEQVFAGLAAARQLDGFELFQRFYEIGSSEGLEDFRGFIRERGSS